jgi:hypothetical protein
MNSQKPESYERSDFNVADYVDSLLRDDRERYELKPRIMQGRRLRDRYLHDVIAPAGPPSPRSPGNGISDRKP